MEKIEVVSGEMVSGDTGEKFGVDTVLCHHLADNTTDKLDPCVLEL